MLLEIITPEKQLYNDEATLVQLPGTDGLFEVLNSHAPMIAALAKGRIKVQPAEGETMFFEINGGVLEVRDNKLLVLADK